MRSFSRRPVPVPRARYDLALAALLFGGIVLLRLGAPSSIAGINFLYVVPISLLAVEFGLRGGLGGAAIASGLLVVWSVLQHVPHELVEFCLRLVVFLLVGALIGAQSNRRRALEAERQRLMQELSAIVTQDPLTRLPNRRAWDERFSHELERAGRSGDPLTVVAIDLDNLKRINDTRGHAAGDEFIAACATAWRRALRSTDFIARLGGDEFLALLPGSPVSEARAAVGRSV